MLGPNDRLYESEPCVWGNEPHEFSKYLTELRESGSVLDIGSGEGRDAVYLASRGFDVTALDLSSLAIDRLEEIARKRGLAVKGVVGDVRDFDFTRKYDAIVSYYTLQFLKIDEIENVIEKIKDNTAEDGVNVIEMFVQDDVMGNDFPGLVGSEVLRNMYDGWKILKYNESKVRMKKKDGAGVPYMHNMAGIVAVNK